MAHVGAPRWLMGLFLAAALASGTARPQEAVRIGFVTFLLVDGKVTVTNIKRYPLEKVQPPDGVASADWIKGGMKPAK